MRKPSSLVRLLSVTLVAGGAMFAARTHDARAAWPPAPGADMSDKANWPNDFNARWNYISYFPGRANGAPPIDGFDKTLGASGMSIDRAWTLTVGRPDIKIAVIDSGIEWDQPDLVNKAFLNTSELQGDKKPKKANGDACTALDGYDCNGDGIFSVADYAEDARFTGTVAGEKCFKGHDKSKPGDDRAKGDLNRNCMIDPGDVILMFSDNVDDDANGYTDDISGWDFFKNDNDPYDDTRYGHGTGEAKDSSAEANNGVDDVGVCPMCRFIPLRVGDSFIGDSNDFGKAVVYAADSGAKVIQEALGTINNTAFAQTAIDYAYGKGTIILASMADENSRHHNMPATSNHVLTVHSIRYDDQKVESSRTYVAFDTCSNYGGHLSMSISATSCSSEATGRSSGIAGLVMSMAAQEQVDLSAEEAMQLFKMNADDINVDASRGDSPMYYYSQSGFDQRFGYGRANAFRMVQAVHDRLIPPEVDITSPTWFAPVHADRVNASVAIMGHVSAKRAKAYDFKVQWAPGVQPEENEYKDLVAPLTNVPGATISGGTVPLAQLDPNQIDTTHPRDPDSLKGENDRSISIRVQAVAHYDNGDVKGEARRVISVTNEKNGADKDLLPGFPIAMGSSAEASPKLADIDGDGIRDIVVGDSSGKLHVYTLQSGLPVEVPGFPYLSRVIDGLNKDLTTEPTVPSYRNAPAYAGTGTAGIDTNVAREAIMAAPAIADLDGDGRVEIVFTTWSGTIYVVNTKGQDLPGWPKRLPLVPSCPHDPAKATSEPCMDLTHGYARGTYSAPVLADMNKDGKPEIIVSGFDGNIWVFKTDASNLDGFPVALKSTLSEKPSRIMATPTVVDLNGDGIPEIASGSNQQIGGGGNAGPVFVVDGRGNNAPGAKAYLPNWPITTASLKLFPVVAEGIVASEAAADFDGDGVPEIVIQGNGTKPLLLKADPGAQPDFKFDPPNRVPDRGDDKGLESTGTFGEMTKAEGSDVFFPLFSQPSIGDLDQDGTPDVIVSGGSLSLAGALANGTGHRAERAQQLVAAWSGKTGKMLPGSPFVIEDYTFLVNHAIADVSGDAYPEIITGSGGYFLHAFDGCGSEPQGWPKFTNGWIASTAAVGDIDGDASKKLEVVVSTRDGYLFAWRTEGKSEGPIEWESFHHDNANTGAYSTKLDQGTSAKATKPLTCEGPTQPPKDEFDAGGCGCRTSGGEKKNALFGITGVFMALAALLRRRRT